MNLNINIRLTALGVVYAFSGYVLVKATKEIKKAMEAEARIKEIKLVLDKDLERYKV